MRRTGSRAAGASIREKLRSALTFVKLWRRIAGGRAAVIETSQLCLVRFAPDADARSWRKQTVCFAAACGGG
jgi:hypothetical protein